MTSESGLVAGLIELAAAAIATSDTWVSPLGPCC
jgi:hypothetical protein